MELESAAEKRAAPGDTSAVSEDESKLLWTCEHCGDDQSKVNIKAHVTNKLSVYQYLEEQKDTHTNLLLPRHYTHVPVERTDYCCELNPLAFPTDLLVKPVLLISDTARLRREERAWLSDGRAALHHFAGA